MFHTPQIYILLTATILDSLIGLCLNYLIFHSFRYRFSAIFHNIGGTNHFAIILFFILLQKIRPLNLFLYRPNKIPLNLSTIEFLHT
jgi:hypothetical protein